MNRRNLVLVAVSVAALAVIGLATGLIRPSPANRDSRPPCDQLPSRKAAEQALASHADLKERIAKNAKGAAVEVAMPCDGEDRGIIRITYSGDAQREAIQAVLLDGGFGAPVELVRAT